MLTYHFYTLSKPVIPNYHDTAFAMISLQIYSQSAYFSKFPCKNLPEFSYPAKYIAITA